MIQFLLNDQQVTVADFDAEVTVLDYLRQTAGLCGTKEGCASGDCGACTVVIAEPATDGLNYQAINSCITFLGSLHGKQLITVEHLAQGEKLHPVQQAMVDHHGSQCGFCTPGFIMSLFAMSHQPEVAEDNRLQTIHENLGGNLCRCTGYRPIIDAATEIITKPASDQFDQQASSVALQLIQINQQDSPVPGRSPRYFAPQSVAELAALYTDLPDARLLAGGTDLALEVTQKLDAFAQVIDLSQIEELQFVAQDERYVTIGAGVSLQQCKMLFQQDFPPISDLLHRFGSRQIRNQGTIGGNVANASPIGDLPPVLLALDAELILQQGETQRQIPIDEFFLGYRQTALNLAEFIYSIRIPLPDPGQQFKVYKISKRLDDDISAVCLAIKVNLSEQQRMSDVRVALGGMAATSRRATQCEQALSGEILNQQTIQLAARALEQDFSPIDDARASAGYRMQSVQNLLQRFLLEVQQAQIQTRVEHVQG